MRCRTGLGLALAALLSAGVPGAGYLYADRPQTAAAAFIAT